jgi:hypothetical protein
VNEVGLIYILHWSFFWVNSRRFSLSFHLKYTVFDRSQWKGCFYIRDGLIRRDLSGDGKDLPRTGYAGPKCRSTLSLTSKFD